MTKEQHQCVARASRLLLYSLKWLDKVMADELPEKEKKRLQRSSELVRKALDKL